MKNYYHNIFWLYTAFVESFPRYTALKLKTPFMTEYVWRAKQIRYKMTERADIAASDIPVAENIFPRDEPEPHGEPNLLDNVHEIEKEWRISVTAPVASLHQPTVEPANNSIIAATGMDTSVFRMSTNVGESPRPLVHRQTPPISAKKEGDDLKPVLKAQILQDGLRRDYEHQRRQHKLRKI